MSTSQAPFFSFSLLKHTSWLHPLPCAASPPQGRQHDELAAPHLGHGSLLVEPGVLAAHTIDFGSANSVQEVRLANATCCPALEQQIVRRVMTHANATRQCHMVPSTGETNSAESHDTR